jgi:hypothetical protein
MEAGGGVMSIFGQDRKYPDLLDLADRDLDVLVSRAISPDVAAARGYVTVAAEASRAYGFAGQQAMAGLIIPRRNTQGFTDPAAQLRPHDPRPDEKGRPRKYELPAGAKQILDVTPHSLPFVTDVSVPILITESILKEDAIQSAIDPGQYCVVGVNGTYGWRSGGAPLSDFWDVPLCEKRGETILRRREVTILFDSDTATNRKVTQARHLFTEFLERRGAKVQHVDLPPDCDGTKQGIDDALANGHTLARLLAMAHPPRRPDPDDFPDDPDLEKIADLEATIRDLEGELRKERAVRNAEHRILGDSRRPPQERISGVLLAAEIERIHKHGSNTLAHATGAAVAVDETGGALVNVKRLAEIAGCSPKHAGDCLRAFEAQGVIGRTVTRVATGEDTVTGDGEIKPQYVSIVRVTPRGTVETLRGDILMADPYRTPKKKPAPVLDRCPDHPDAQILTRIHDECGVCHKQISESRDRWRPAGTPPTDADSTPNTAPLRIIAQKSPEVISEQRESLSVDPPSLAAPTFPITTPQVISDLAPAKAALADADHATERDELHRATDAIAERLAPIAEARGRSPVPKPSAEPGFRGRGHILDSLRNISPGAD